MGEEENPPGKLIATHNLCRPFLGENSPRYGNTDQPMLWFSLEACYFLKEQNKAQEKYSHHYRKTSLYWLKINKRASGNNYSNMEKAYRDGTNFTIRCRRY